MTSSLWSQLDRARAAVPLVLIALASACHGETAAPTAPGPTAEQRAGRLSARVVAPSGTVTTGLSVQKLSATGRPFGLYVPTNYDPRQTWPVALMLHGYGSSGEEMVLNFQEYAEAAGVVVVAPNSFGPTWDLILNSEFGADRTHIDNVLTWVFGHVAADSARIAISGFSDGATYALWLGLKNGDLFTRVAAFTPCSTVPRTRTGMPRIFISHGIDDVVLPIESCSRQTVPVLEEAGYSVEFVEYASAEGNGHFITPAVITQGMQWLAQR